MRGSVIVAVLASIFAACGNSGDGASPLSRDELLDPSACQECHPDHYQQWLGSSHAYAADDPVFLAMNARFQSDTAGAYPSDCVRCHAPVALAEGKTTDGLDLADVPAELRGVTCFACHVVEDANPTTHTFTLATDDTLRGGIDDPKRTGAHDSIYSDLLDRAEWRSTDMCGTCHEFDSRSGVHAHRTHTEWLDSLFADTFSRSFLSCSGCHMDGADGPVATGNVPIRRLHDHSFPGVNLATQDWPEKETQRQEIHDELSQAVLARICLTGDTKPQVILDNLLAGHMFPSGDAATRRVWVELTVYQNDQVVYQSGVVDDSTPVTSATRADPNLWVLRDTFVDDNGDEVLFPWLASDVSSELLAPAVTSDPSDPRYYHARSHDYPALGFTPDRMTIAVHMRPIALDLIDNLVTGGELDSSIRAQIPTFTLDGTVVEWTGSPGTCVPPLNP